MLICLKSAALVGLIVIMICAFNNLILGRTIPDCNSFVSVAIIGVYFVLQLAKGWIHYYEWQNNPCALIAINKRQLICFGCNSRRLFCVTCNKQNLLSLNLRPGLTRPINKTSTKWAPETERWKYQNWILWRKEKGAIVLFKGINYGDLFP